MTTPERAQGGQQGRGRLPRETGGFSPAIFPPLDSQREGISKEDRLLSNADILAIAAEVSKKQKSVRTLLAGMILGGGLVTGGYYAKEVFADEPPPEPTPATRDIDSIPGFNSNEGQQLVASQENPLGIPVAKEVKNPNPDEVFDKNADKQTVKAGRNAIPIPQVEALALAKENPPQLIEGEFPTLPLVFIGKLKDGEVAIIDTHYVNQAYNPIEHKPDTLNSGRYIEFKKS